MAKGKPEVITFKAEPALVEAMEGIKNRSEFIRAAIISALDGVCPLCRGTGILTPEQKKHWQSFARHHKVERCETCDAHYLVCQAPGAGEQGH
ncbi:MAG: ribbon-helix-helix domain-containing protein [Desulfarculaceae bacterium]|nr:ribbon-helix-helix domain-containing protein [Desulfarculaceae bacterium]